MKQNNLYNKLKKYSKSNTIPMHMPGHKRNIKLLGEKLPYELDITEINDFDDLHHAEGIIKNIEKKAKKTFNSKRSFLLVNGSTCGLLAGIRSVVKPKDKILVARNSHKSVYNAIEMNFLEPIYIEPEIDENDIYQEITPEAIERQLELNKDIKLIVLTSPTYEGIISNIKTIVEIAHSYNIPVLVDEAHGAHLNFMDKIKEYEALNCDADIVIQSLHKTLPSLTQTAILHIKGNLVNEVEVAKQLAIFETSSPSYLFMVSIEECIDFINNNKYKFINYQEKLDKIYNKTKMLKHLKILGNVLDNNIKYDLGKIVILTKDTKINGKELANILRKNYKIEVEMSYINYVICMTSVCDSNKNFKKLLKAILDIDKRLENNQIVFENGDTINKYNKKEKKEKQEENTIYYKEAEGKVMDEYMWVYPPGIPLIMPGETVSVDLIKKIEKIVRSDLQLRTTNNKFPYIIIKNKN